MKIAIVEQDDLLSELISFRLELLGHEVVSWCSAGDMFERLSENEIHLLIIDTYQPDMPGWEAIQKVRLRYSAEVLPILVVSIDTDLSLVEQAYRAGANDYLITPFDPAVLQDKTDKLLLGNHLQRH